MMHYYLLASGSKGNSFFLEEGDTRLLVDCGTTKRYLSASFQAVGIEKEKLSAVLITHTHSDHISQIMHFQDLPIYSPMEIGEIPVHEITKDTPFTIGEFQITPISLSHDVPKTTGYVFETTKEKLVYITDTGYVKQIYWPLLTDADYIVLESNYDPEMLMDTNRPQYVKARIHSDSGHLCNSDAANLLNQIVTEKTKRIFLAHISQQANNQQCALDTTCDCLVKEHQGVLNKNLVVSAAGQYEILEGGTTYEEVDADSCSRYVGLESMAYRSTHPSTK